MKNESVNFLYKERDNQFRNTAGSIKNIYDKIIDSRSRSIFMNRVCFSMTENPVYMKNVIYESLEGGVGKKNRELRVRLD